MNGNTRARLLFVGDIHLGRRPTRLPDDLAEHGVDPADLTPAAAWRRTAQYARELAAEPEGLAAVVLAGDVVESLEDRFGAFPHLERGVQEIVEAGVPVYGVAGNHDVQALPLLADRIDDFHLLGRGGTWERIGLECGIDLVGWSFPRRVVRESPLATYPQPASDGAPAIGVLHCDLDGGRSRYAPVARAELERARADAWLLGHVHAPSDLGGDRPVGYLGSLLGLDPGEPGRRGPWIVRVDDRGRVDALHVPLAPLRWERETVVVDDEALASGGADAESVRETLHAAGVAALERVRARVEAEAPPPRVVGVRLLLEGVSRHRADLRAWREARESWPVVSRNGMHLFTEKVEDRTRPAVDLDAIALGTDPPALLARRLLALERGGPEADGLLASLTPRLAAVRSDGRFGALADEDEARDPAADARERLLRIGLELLEDLLAQRAQAAAEAAS